MNRPVYFLHIPKTAGASVTLFLDQLYSKDEIFPYQRWDHLFSQNSIKKAKGLIHDPKFKFFRGHFACPSDFVNHKFVFTMLRNPITRTISQYRHILRSPNDNWTSPTFLKRPDESLKEILTDASRASYITNLQVRYLSSSYNPLITKKNKYEDRYLHDCQKQFVEYTIDNPRKALIVALYRLITIGFFGLQEFFEESMLMLSDKLKIKLPLPTEKVHLYEKESSLNDIDPETYNLLDCTNNLDSKLYFIAKRIFVKKFLNFLNKKTGKDVDFYFYLQHRHELLESVQ